MKIDNTIFLQNEEKICPVCRTINQGKSTFYCTKCNTWIPHLNTSWVRSVTNLFLVKRILEAISVKDKFLREDLLKILVNKKIISVDLARAKNKKYWLGGPSRKASEYIQIFKYLGIIEPKTGKNFIVNDLGKKIITADKRLDFITPFVLILVHFNPSNKFAEPQYADLKGNYFLLVLDLINEMSKLSKLVSVEHIGLAFMCRNEEDYKNAKAIALGYSKKELVETIWGNSRELNRVVQGVFLRWLEQAKLIEVIRDPRNFRIDISKFGIKILNKYWEHAFDAKNLSLVDTLVDEPSIRKEMEDISDLLISSTNSQDRYKLTLNVKQGTIQKMGGAWEQYVFNHLVNLNLGPRWYKETQDFVKVQLPNHVINALTGGTRFNPDIIFYSPIFLVDPKDDVNKEMYKVQAYDGYANHPEVDANALIVSKELMGKKEAERMKDFKKTYVIDKDALNLLVNNKKDLNKDSILKILGYGCKYGEYLNEELLLEKIDSLT